MDVKNDSGRNLVVALGGAGAAELRDELHRAVRQPGAELDPDRGRPVQDREAQGAPAEHDRRQPLSGLGQGHGGGRDRRRHRRARDHRLSRGSSLAGRDGVLSGRAEAGKEASDPARSSPTPAPRRPTRSSSVRQRAERLEDRVRAQDGRPHRAGTRTRKCRPASLRRRRRSPATTRRPSTSPRAARSASTQFRVAVGTSTMWGIVGVGIIAHCAR